MEHREIIGLGGGRCTGSCMIDGGRVIKMVHGVCEDAERNTKREGGWLKKFVVGLFEDAERNTKREGGRIIR